MCKKLIILRVIFPRLILLDFRHTYKIFCARNIIRVIKVKRMKWLERVAYRRKIGLFGRWREHGSWTSL